MQLGETTGRDESSDDKSISVMVIFTTINPLHYKRELYKIWDSGKYKTLRNQME